MLCVIIEKDVYSYKINMYIIFLGDDILKEEIKLMDLVDMLMRRWWIMFISMVVVAVIACTIIYLIRKADKEIEKEYALKGKATA